MNEDRFARWVQSSWLKVGEPFMAVVLQGLGSLDCELIAQDDDMGRLSQEELATPPASNSLTKRVTLSYLWVLGAYEYVRTMDQKCSADSSLVGQAHTDRFRDLKLRMERLRIPLAKFERARKHPTDSPIAYPAYVPGCGIAWGIAPGVVISRRELSDALLQLVSDIRATAVAG